jgi:hypothetical protein
MGPQKQAPEEGDMASDVPRLRTPGVIADELGEPLTRVLYVLRKLNIRPIGRAGVLRLYDRDAAGRVRQELDAIDARRCRKAVAE